MNTLQNASNEQPAAGMRWRAAVLMTVGVLAALAALAVLGVSIRLLMLGLGAAHSSAMLVAAVVLALIAAFLGALGWMAIRYGRDVLRRRQQVYYPGL